MGRPKVLSFILCFLAGVYSGCKFWTATISGRLNVWTSMSCGSVYESRLSSYPGLINESPCPTVEPFRWGFGSGINDAASFGPLILTGFAAVIFVGSLPFLTVLPGR